MMNLIHKTYKRDTYRTPANTRKVMATAIRVMAMATFVPDVITRESSDRCAELRYEASCMAKHQRGWGK